MPAKALPWRVAACLFSLIATVATAVCQPYPTRTITAVMPFGPGTSIETSGRVVLEQVSKALGQPIVVENRPGAGGTTAAAGVARSEPDGHTLLMFSSSFSIAHATFQNRSYDTLKDFVAVATYGIAPNVLVVPADRGWKSLADLVTAAKARPGALNYASIGNGSAPHLTAEQLGLAAGIKAQNVAFRGPADALTETMTGRVDYYWAPLATVLPMVREGKLLPLAVSNAVRTSMLPHVPTLIEQGYRDALFEIWHGIFAPAATPPAIVARLHSEVEKALEVPSVKERFAALGVEPLRMSQPAFVGYFAKDVARMVDLVQRAGIKGN